MAVSNTQNQSLGRILQARRDAAQAEFEGICAQIAKVRGILTQLGHKSQAPDAAYLALGADDLWQHWVAQRREALFMELARLHVLKEDKARILKKTNGRAQAFDTVIKREDALQAQLLERKALASLNEMLISQQFARHD